jgi:uncharacterized membrane protein
MRNSQLGASALTVVGIILLVLGALAIIAAPQVMNSSEVNTLRGIGGGAALLGAILGGVGMSKSNK